MCTLSYIPKPKNGFILVHNRDEAGKRNSSKPPIQKKIKSDQIIYPVDAQTGGTWIAASENGRFISLLNGAFEKHKRELPYRLSRGFVIHEYFESEGIIEFSAAFNFDKIEPFTLFVIEDYQVFEFRWDGKQKYLKELDPKQSHFYSSTTLYSDDVQKERINWFRSWHYKNPHPGFQDLLKFHHEAGEEDPINALVMNRDEIVKTVSITGFECNDKKTTLHYENLIDKRIYSKEIPRKKIRASV